jgi:hypothetical protein
LCNDVKAWNIIRRRKRAYGQVVDLHENCTRELQSRQAACEQAWTACTAPRPGARFWSSAREVTPEERAECVRNRSRCLLLTRTESDRIAPFERDFRLVHDVCEAKDGAGGWQNAQCDPQRLLNAYDPQCNLGRRT